MQTKADNWKAVGAAKVEHYWRPALSRGRYFYSLCGLNVHYKFLDAAGTSRCKKCKKMEVK